MPPNVAEIQQEHTTVTECPGDTIFTSSLKKSLARGPQKNNNKIKLQFSKPEFILNNKMWKELRKQEAATVNDSQRMQSKPRHRQLKSFANAQTHSKLH